MPAHPPLESRLSAMGLQLLHLSETDSTNLLAAQRAQEGALDGLVVLADSQQQGRGRQGRSWSSPAGCGLFVSFLRRPSLGAQDAWLWTLLAGTAAHAAISEVREDCWLKWPNDLIANERKLGGILCELQTGLEASIESIVVGIGLNLFLPPGGWEQSIEDRAGSIWPGVPDDEAMQRRDDLLVSLASHFLLMEEDLEGAGRAALLMRYRAAMLPMVGRTVTVELAGRRLEARVEGISDKGALEVLDEGGQRQRLLAGDVHLHGQGAVRN